MVGLYFKDSRIALIAPFKGPHNIRAYPVWSLSKTEVNKVTKSTSNNLGALYALQ